MAGYRVNTNESSRPSASRCEGTVSSCCSAGELSRCVVCFPLYHIVLRVSPAALSSVHLFVFCGCIDRPQRVTRVLLSDFVVWIGCGAMDRLPRDSDDDGGGNDSISGTTTAVARTTTGIQPARPPAAATATATTTKTATTQLPSLRRYAAARRRRWHVRGRQ